MEPREVHGLATGGGEQSTYSLPSASGGASGPETATSIHVMESPGLRADDAAGRTEDAREGLAARSPGDGEEAARAETEARVERARHTRRVRDGEAGPAMAAPLGLVLAAGAGFVAGAMWAMSRR